MDSQLTEPTGNTPNQRSQSSSRAIRFGDRIVLFIARHWLAMANLALFTFIMLPFMAPILMRAGMTGAARIIYTVYVPTCHQLPDRSYFLFGDQTVYTLGELETAGVLPGTSILQRRKYIGDETIGYKVAICERDIAIYGSMVIGGLIFGLLRKRRRVPNLPIGVYLLFLVPIALDGFSQLFGFRTSNWFLRTITGALFGLATVWLAYPYVQESMDDIQLTTEQRLAQETGQIEQPGL
ncbi:MAG: DUF2085 domain-containing protein [Anaerolineae bacterium]|nr:DUF2085 domain-containing protein [Anaerolineae bacterium]MCB0198906.1 DUF2085 domain-containing protein [Anaerolineae bacterium]MCB0205397.1 DUF2085 domain-containing protein [Anaerolineae bacterium]MCB0252819.1 DUF2085 domain-containing protein [Anaerolineae bacterium]